jgi:hypothetical protein
MKPAIQKATMLQARRSGRLTQWAAQFAVASELCKRGYEVSFTMGNNTPIADLMVASPIKHEHFLIDVKGLYKKNPWVVSRKEIRANLFYVLAFVPTDEPNQFFVLSQNQMNRYIKIELDRLGRDSDYPMTGILWKMAFNHKDDWGILPK